MNKEEKSLLNKFIVGIAHFIGFSGLLVLFIIFEIARLSSTMSAGGTETEWIVDLSVIGLWAWLKFLVPLWYNHVIPILKNFLIFSGDFRLTKMFK